LPRPYWGIRRDAHDPMAQALGKTADNRNTASSLKKTHSAFKPSLRSARWFRRRRSTTADCCRHQQDETPATRAKSKRKRGLLALHQERVPVPAFESVAGKAIGGWRSRPHGRLARESWVTLYLLSDSFDDNPDTPRCLSLASQHGIHLGVPRRTVPLPVGAMEWGDQMVASPPSY